MWESKIEKRERKLKKSVSYQGRQVEEEGKWSPCVLNNSGADAQNPFRSNHPEYNTGD